VTLGEATIAGLSPACQAARSNHMDARRSGRRWDTYLLIAGAILLLLIAAAAFFFATSATSQAALSTGAAVADGAALGWIVTRRTQAEKNLRHWYGEVVKNCPDNVIEEQKALW
jgi:hypothetical protein